LSKAHYSDVVLVPANCDALQKDGAVRDVAIGAFDASGAFIESFDLLRTSWTSRRAAFVRPQHRLTGEYVYGGVLFPHFGHFLLESLSRVWAIKELHGADILWHSQQPPRLERWQKQVFEILGIDESRFSYITHSTSIESLILPQPGYVNRHFAHPDHIRALDAFCGKRPTPDIKVWLSRSALAESSVRIDGEQELERALESDGWRVVHPQRLSIRDQLEIWSSAEIIAGFAGSAFHLAILIRDLQAKLVIFARRSDGMNANFQTIARARNLHQTTSIFAMDMLPERDGKPHPRIRSADGCVEQIYDVLSGRVAEREPTWL
jgi:capsular polysaccharide biosynthesis protein